MSDSFRRPEFERYHIERRIGVGARGEVFRAHDRPTGETVAIKLLDLPRDPAARNRLLRALHRLQTVRHPNVVRHYAVHVLSDTQAAVVMEWVAGENLEVKLARGWRPPVAEALRLAAAAAAGLAAVHEAGVIHRDIKPENLLLVDRGGLKVADFGLAIPSDESVWPDPQRLTGTAAYLAPELAAARGPWSPASDLYALGCTLYRLVTGQLPYQSNSELELLYLHARAPVPDPSRLNAAVRPAVRDVLRRLLAKGPEERYSSANRLRADLLRLASNRAPGNDLPALGSNETDPV